MQRNLDELEHVSYDIIVIGGGFFGAFAAWDASLRGLSVCLLERGDFCAETSANSYKLIHGGIRYLQHGDLPRVLRSSRERAAFLRIAPHLVKPVPILIPTYGLGKRGKLLLRAGFAAYDALTWRRNRRIPDPARQIPRSRSVSREEALREFPELDKEGLTGGVVFADGQMQNPPRLALAALRAAAENGARLANRVEVTELIREGNEIRGVRGRDLLSGTPLAVTGSVVLNAAGPWGGALLRSALGFDLGERAPAFSRDVGLVVRRRLESPLGLACPTSTRDADALVDRGGRHLFFLPWRGYNLVGVWHGRFDGPPETVDLSDGELQEFLAEANAAYRGLNLTPDDVLTIHTGLIVYNDDEGGEGHRFGRRSTLIDHSAEDGIRGLVTIMGERATMARAAAQEALDLAQRQLGTRIHNAGTDRTPVFGGDFTTFEELVSEISERVGGQGLRRALARRYGTGYREVLRLAEEDPRLARPVGDANVLAAEVPHAVRKEMALSLEDVIFRRTDLGIGARPSSAQLTVCAGLMAEELGWGSARVEEEVERVETLLRRRGTYGDAGSSTHTLRART